MLRNRRIVVLLAVLVILVAVAAFGIVRTRNAQAAEVSDVGNTTAAAFQSQLTDAQAQLAKVQSERNDLAAQIEALPTPDPNSITYTVTKDGYDCPEMSTVVGGNPVNWRPVDVNLDDTLNTKADGCGSVLLNWQKISLTVDLPEGWILNKPSKTYGPAVIHTFNEPVTLWFPGYDDVGECPDPTTLALGTSSEDWTRLDANNDGKIDLENDWCGYLLTSWDSKNLTFNAAEGTEIDQSTVVTGPAQYDTNRLPATVWQQDQ